MVAAMPGLTFWQAGVNNQSSTTIANTLPLGGALATGVSYTMFRSWGFTNGEIALEAVVTGVWNTFIKLAMPVISLAALAVTGQATAALVIPTAIGIAVLLVAVALFALMLRSKELARRSGRFLDPEAAPQAPRGMGRRHGAVPQEDHRPRRETVGGPHGVHRGQ